MIFGVQIFFQIFVRKQKITGKHISRFFYIYFITKKRCQIAIRMWITLG